MKRGISILLLVAGALAGSALLTYGPLIAAPPESEELTPPVMSPGVILPDVPTFITITTSLSDPNVRRPRLQVFVPATGKWKTIKRLRDDGKHEDTVDADGTFTLRIHALASQRVTTISLEGRRGLRAKAVVPSPPSLRLVAKRQRQRGIVVSSAIALAIPPVTLEYPSSLLNAATIADPIVTPRDSGATFVEVPVAISGGVPRSTFGISVEQNLSGQSLEEWFSSHVDVSGALSAAATFQSVDLSDGKHALLLVAPVPETYDGEPLPYAYVLSPAGDKVASLTLSQDHDLDLLGYATVADQVALLRTLVESLTFTE